MIRDKKACVPLVTAFIQPQSSFFTGFIAFSPEWRKWILSWAMHNTLYKVVSSLAQIEELGSLNTWTAANAVRRTDRKTCSSQSRARLCDLTASSLPSSYVHGISWVRIPEWVAILFSRGSSWSRDRTQNLWDAAKATLRGKFIGMEAFIKKQEKSRVNNLTYYLKQKKNNKTWRKKKGNK